MFAELILLQHNCTDQDSNESDDDDDDDDDIMICLTNCVKSFCSNESESLVARSSCKPYAYLYFTETVAHSNTSRSKTVT